LYSIYTIISLAQDYIKHGKYTFPGRNMIRLEGNVLEAVERLRIHPRETLDELLDRLYEELSAAGDDSGMDEERFIEMLAEGRFGKASEKALLASS
jgi:hypothetical protein